MSARNALILASVLLVAPLARASDDPQQIAERVAQTYQGLKAYHFEGSTRTQMKSRTSDTGSEVRFNVAFEPPGRFRMEYQYPSAGDWIRVSDGKTLTRYRSITKQVNKQDASPDDLRILDSAPIATYMHLDKVAKDAKLDGSETLTVNGMSIDCYILEVPGKASILPNSSPLPTKLWVDKGSYLVYREESGTKSGTGENQTQDIRTTNYTVAQVKGDIADNLFAFSPSK